MLGLSQDFRVPLRQPAGTGTSGTSERNVLQLSPPPQLEAERLRRALQKQYARMALFPGKTYHLHTGRFLVDRLGYDTSLVDDLPRLAVDSFCGAANPFALGRPSPGASVLDVGCGSGMDALIAAGMVGPGGRVIGVDLTPEMARTAELAAKQAKIKQAEFRVGLAEVLPVGDESVDFILSNGVINHLCLDKHGPWREIARALRPGGTALVADVMVGNPLPPAARDELNLWTT